jgi:N-acetylgalactosamine-6-sulfatase
MNARQTLELLCALLIVGGIIHPADADPPPNIVFIFADDWGWGDLSCHGHPYLRTPNIDRLANEGVDFKQFNVSSPVCSPSRTAAMTGQFPARYSVHQHFAEHQQNRRRGMPDWLDPKVVLLSRLLQQTGYRTGHFGKWHLTSDTISDAPSVQVYGFDESAVFNGPPPHANHDTMMDAAIRFIRLNKDRPFYVNVWLHETHTAHFPRKEMLEKYSDLDEQHRVYAAVVEEGDQKVGQILEALHELNIEDRTMVIFSGDNGPEWTGPAAMKQLRNGLGTYYSVGKTGRLRGRKRSLFEGGVRTPFILRWPGHAPPGVVDESTVIAAVDLLPTLCAAAGVALPDGYTSDGENMLSAFKGTPIRRTKPIYWEWRGTHIEPDWWPRLAVRVGDWKLFMSADKKRTELYNLSDDPSESNNLAEAEPDRIAQMAQLAKAWQSTIPTSPPPDCISTQLTTTNK